eukprot:g35317.t1
MLYLASDMHLSNGCSKTYLSSRRRALAVVDLEVRSLVRGRATYDHFAATRVTYATARAGLSLSDLAVPLISTYFSDPRTSGDFAGDVLINTNSGETYDTDLLCLLL